MAYVLAISAVVALAFWDAHRRGLAEQRARREFERDLSNELASELRELTEHLSGRVETQEKALTAFLVQVRDVVRFSEERRKEAESKSITAGLQGRNR